ncbi:MAG: pyruvate formate lyase family protein [Smithella sp.]|nr:pyruvate formate lyase family protein [Smithella sp.]
MQAPENIASRQVPGYLGLAVSASKLGFGKLFRKRQILLEGFLSFIAGRFNTSEALRDELKGTQGWINLCLGMRSEDNKIEAAIVFKDGAVSVLKKIPQNVETVIIFKTSDNILDMTDSTPDEMYKMMLTGIIRTEGNIMLASLFNYLMALVFDKGQQKAVDRQIEEHKKANKSVGREVADSDQCRQDRPKRKISRVTGRKVDPGVKYLADPHLASYGLEDFPRLDQFRAAYFGKAKEAVVCHEYGKLITDFHLANGYEVDQNDNPWDPNLRKAESLKYILEHRTPVIRENDLLAATYTTSPVSTCVGHPFSIGCYSWGELRSFAKRELMPYEISEESIQILHKHVFPYWVKRNIHELWRSRTNSGLPVQIHDRFFSVYYWKTISMSEVPPGHEALVKLGTQGMIRKIEEELERDEHADDEKKNTLKAMIISLEGVNAYARNLARRALEESKGEKDQRRKAELEKMHQMLLKIPEHPAETLYDAVQNIILMHICLGMESTDDGPMYGRLDQILQPYFESDMNKLAAPQKRDDYIKQIIEILGCLYFIESSHQILAPDIGNWQNGGSSPNGTITLGGVTPQGEDAVNDMTYILLKVTELLALNNPNVHARYKPGVNSLDYLKRVCDVNYITGATPCIHGDDAVIEALTAHGWPIEDVRDWVVNGCVEPAIPGKHCSATSSIEFNLVAPLEMALNNGKHPLMNWKLGPTTGIIEEGDFETFEDFWKAFKGQGEFLFGQSIIGNNQLGEVYQEHQPAPLISSMTEGCIESGRGVTRGGAKYNSSGVSVIGMADVVDSLMSIKKLVFDEKVCSFAELKKAIDNNFKDNPKLHTLIKTRAPRFGSGNEESVTMANRVTSMVHDYFVSHKNYRGGHHATGWWSMANHTVYGRVTGALPSGRLAGEPFTPGLTPHPSASPNLLDNLRDVAKLDPKTLDNNIAFNVKIVPSSKDSHERVIEIMANYADTYFRMGGMQTQFNVISTDMLKDAMANPEHYSDLMVRISGYVAYFTRLQRDLQMEVIRRAEYKI